MQNFPLFLSLCDRRALVVGGGDPAARKIELLLSAGAQVSLVAVAVTGEIAQLIADGRISWAGRAFAADELEGVAIVIVASDDVLLQGRVSHAAQARGLPVNVVDTPSLSSFIMPAIVDRGPITIAISTGGTAPALARKLRAEIERALPAAIGRLARFAEIFRAQVRRTLAEPGARRRFWDRVFDGRVGELALAGDEIAARRELIRLLDSARSAPAPAQGMVHLVGAGPGDPDLLTLKAHRLLQRADVIVYDRLVSPDIVVAGRRDAERFLVSPGEVASRLVALARAGKSVVRLAAVESFPEIEALRSAGIPLEVVPGVAALAPAVPSVKSSG
jgi:uroporphyrin-III C-methyltransferase/precorrin-2 dehydrogenase/sirohydrochlorin ferrochelatase